VQPFLFHNNKHFIHLIIIHIKGFCVKVLCIAKVFHLFMFEHNLHVILNDHYMLFTYTIFYAIISLKDLTAGHWLYKWFLSVRQLQCVIKNFLYPNKTHNDCVKHSVIKHALQWCLQLIALLIIHIYKKQVCRDKLNYFY